MSWDVAGSKALFTVAVLSFPVPAPTNHTPYLRYESEPETCAMVTAPVMDSGSTGSSPERTSRGTRYTGSNSPTGRTSRGMGARVRPLAEGPGSTYTELRQQWRR